MTTHKLSKGSMTALEMLRKGHTTATEMKSEGFQVNSAHLTALLKKNLATAKQVNLVCECCGHKRKVNQYTLTEKGEKYTQEG